MSGDTHKCPAASCSRQIPFEQMACRPHWFSLPPELRKRVSKAWRSGDLHDILNVRTEVEIRLGPKVVSS